MADPRSDDKKCWLLWTSGEGLGQQVCRSLDEVREYIAIACFGCTANADWAEVDHYMAKFKNPLEWTRQGTWDERFEDGGIHALLLAVPLLAPSAEPLGKPVAYAWRSKRDGSYGQIEERAEELRRDPWIKNGVAEIVPLYAAPFDCPSCGRPASKTIADACGQDPCALRSPERFNAASPELPAAASLSATKAPAITGADHGGDAQAHVTSAQYPGNAAPSNVAPRRCPTCDGPDPALHPAVQAGGEVQLCRDPWHKPTADEIEAKERAERSSEPLGTGETPRTDALWKSRDPEFDSSWIWALCRQLERELAAMTEERDKFADQLANREYDASLAPSATLEGKK